MTIDATAEALATQPALPEVATTQEDDLGAIWDKANADEPPQEVEAEATEAAQEPQEAQEQADGEPDQPEEAEAVTEAPTELPKAIRDAWKDIPPSARDAFLDSQREMSRRLGEQGRQLQGITPIRDVLVKAAQDMPHLAQMRPQDVADQVFELAKVSQNFSEKPVETMMGLIEQHGLADALRQRLAGQQPEQAAMQPNALLQRISQLEGQLKQYADPEFLRGQVAEYTTEAQLQGQVSQFAAQAEHWGVVEDKMPAAIQFVRANAPDASPQDVLKSAYELAVGQFVPEAKAKPQEAAPEAAPATDPAKTEAALKAKSVNIRSKPTDKARTLTEEEELSRVWDRMQQA